MIYSVTGKLIRTEPTFAVIECSGVAFRCFISMSTASRLPKNGETATLFTYLNVKEDALDLYGFYDERELEFFRLLITVSGVGPKAAMAILSALNPDRIALAIASSDAKTIATAQGVGIKTAQRVVLELKDKIGAAAMFSGDTSDSVTAASIPEGSSASDAVSALVSLGYTLSDAASAVGRLDKSLPADELIKGALKYLARI